MYIESSQNPRVKAWSQLKSKKGRQVSGLFLIEGIRLVDEVLRSALDVESVLWDVGTDEPDDGIRTLLKQRNLTLTELSPTAFAAVADTVTPQGIMAVARIPEPKRAASFASETELAVAFDGIQDPGNLGTLLRSADAFGARIVCCGTGSVDPYSPKVVRASMGGLFRLHVVSQSTPSFIERWRKGHVSGQVVTTSADADIPCYELDFRRATLLLIGSEASGVSAEAETLSNARVQIPMEGHAESLNAAMAGSVLLYEAYRQRCQPT